MKITLICPTFYDPEGQLFKPKKAMIPPLSILYLAGLTPPEHTVTVVDEAVQEIDFDAPVDLVGITSTSINIRRAYEVADEFRRRNIPVVMGGIHVTTLPEEAQAHADCVVLGEGDDAWPALLRDFAEGRLLPRYQLPPRDNLAGLPHPRYDLIDTPRYITPPFSATAILPVQTARGCPHNCDFCSVTQFWGKRIRLRPIADIVEEVRRSGARVVLFTDDNFFAQPKRARELCAALQPLNIRFFCQIDSISHKREGLIQDAAAAGCILAFVGFESMNPRALAELNKGFNKPDEYAALIRTLHASGIGIYASIMFGLEQDDAAIVDETVDFLIQNKADIAAFFRLVPFPGTALYERLKANGQLVKDDWWLHLGTGIKTLVQYQHAPAVADALVKQANKRFYTLASIARRFGLPRLWQLLPVVMNLQSRKKMKQSGGSCSF